MKIKCSNCGKEAEYNKKEWKGREQTICKKCGHYGLSICSWFIEI